MCVSVSFVSTLCVCACVRACVRHPFAVYWEVSMIIICFNWTTFIAIFSLKEMLLLFYFCNHIRKVYLSLLLNFPYGWQSMQWSSLYICSI